uniref:lipopolysaccharide biosynthesis protein n=1 Tax=Pluralibacter gergoviae TaxID=61647 RepID=UPI0009BD5B52|nr:lipopolysaccharide biosynthesis protein [Pluralibacter gergoviae]
MGLASNAKWNGFSQFFKVTVQLVNLIYLAKIIPPSDYGLLALATIVVNFGILLRDLGTSSAVIQKENISYDLINAVFWLNIFVGFGLMVALVSISGWFSQFYHQPELVSVIILLSLTFPMSSCASVHLALLERESSFKKVSFIEINSSLISVVVAIVLANMGYGVYSLVWQAIALNAISAIQLWICSEWRPKIIFKGWWGEIKKLLGFSVNVSLFNIVNYFSRNADTFFIGRYMNVFTLGNYNLAYRIMLFPLQSLTYVTSRSLYPVLSREQNDDNKSRDIYLNCVFFILMISSPLMTGIAILSQPFVMLVFGSQWSIAAHILTWLAPTAIIQSVISTTGSVFMARGRSSLLFKLGVLGALLQVTSFIIGVQYDIITFSIFYLAANILNFPIVMMCVFKTIGGGFSALLRKIMPIIFATLMLIVFLMLARAYLNIYSIYELIGTSIIGGCIYFFVLYLTSELVRFHIISFLKKN